jgi:hypothetical protein
MFLLALGLRKTNKLPTIKAMSGFDSHPRLHQITNKSGYCLSLLFATSAFAVNPFLDLSQSFDIPG